MRGGQATRWYGSRMEGMIDSMGRTARVVRDEHGDWLARSDTVVTDEMIYALIDAGRR
jgi:hypothetical protein